MPSDILSADTGFPTFTGDMSTDQKIERVTNYLFMLLEQLRYTLSNLGVDNFNDTELVEIGKVISDPIYIRLEDEFAGNLTSLQINVNGIAARVQNAEGNIGTLQLTANSLNTSLSNLQGDVTQVTATANGLVSRVSNAEGNVSSLTQTVNGFNSRISNAEGSVSTLTQTVNSFSSRITNAEGSVSTLTQTVNSFSSRITTAEGDISAIEQSINGIDLVVSNGKVNAAMIAAAINSAGSSVTISADKIKMTGTTTFLSSSENAEGELEINGNSLGITINGFNDKSVYEIESDNGLNFYYDKYGDGDPADYKLFARQYMLIAGEDSEEESRYSLVLGTYALTNRFGSEVSPSLKFFADNKISLEGYKGVYINSSGMGFITLDCNDNTRIRAPRKYSEINTPCGTGYIFCSNGIYYNGNKILSTT